MKKNLLKIKNIIGLLALITLSTLAFLGLNYHFANALASISLTLVIVTIALLLLFLALKGREERTGHSKKWIALGWVSTIMYLLLLIFIMPFCSHYIHVNHIKPVIQKEAIEKIDAMEYTNSDFFTTVDMRSESLKNRLLRHIMANEKPLLQSIYPMHRGSFDSNWAMAERNGLSNTIFDYEVDKLSYTSISAEWDGSENTMSWKIKESINKWRVLVISRAIKNLDNEIDRNLDVMKQAYAYNDSYSDYFKNVHEYNIKEPTKSQLENPIHSKYFRISSDSIFSVIGLSISILIGILAAFPIIFVPSNRVHKNNKRFANIYSEGFSTSDLMY